MATSRPKQLRWVKQIEVPATGPPTPSSPHAIVPTTRERLVAALADRPRTVAQLAQAFGLSQPTMLEHVRRSLRDGLIVEVPVAEGEKRYPSERYYAPAVPVVRQPDRELLESASRALAEEVARALAGGRGDLEAAFAMTTLAREGWSFADLRPYLHDTVCRLALAGVTGSAAPAATRPHGLAWVEDAPEVLAEPPHQEESA